MGNYVEQTANTYKLNAGNEPLIETRKAKLNQLGLALLKHLLIFIIVNRDIIFMMFKTPSEIHLDLFWIQCYKTFYDRKL